MGGVCDEGVTEKVTVRFSGRGLKYDIDHTHKKRPTHGVCGGWTLTRSDEPHSGDAGNGSKGMTTTVRTQALGAEKRNRQQQQQTGHE